MAANVSITIYNIQGHRVRRIEVGERSAGVYFDKETAAYWDGRSDNGELVSSGVYYYHLRAGDFHATRRMVIVK
jgi:flagellar hook assembly protein FlgD